MTWNQLVCGRNLKFTIDDYAKDGGPEGSDFYVVFTMSLCSLELKPTLIKFAISNHTALKLHVQALTSYLSLICEYELYTLPNKKSVPQRSMVKTT